jgi:uncharacterized protein (UPF0332 family)
MPEGNRTALADYRLERASGELASSRDNLNAGRYSESLSDSYYAIFHAIRAALALEAKDFKKHSGVISYFQAQYIKTGVFPKEISFYIQGAFRLRARADYEDFYFAARGDAEQQLENAEKVYSFVEKYLAENKSLLPPGNN